MLSQVLQILLEVFILILAGMIFRFSHLRNKRVDRKLRLYFGVICLTVLGIAVIANGIDLN